MSKVKALSKIARMIINDGNKAAERKFGKEAVKKTKSKEGEIIKKFKEADRRGFRDASLESGRSVRSKSLRKARDAKRKTESKTQDVFREPKIEEPLRFGKGGIVKKVIRQLRDDYKPRIKNEKEVYPNVKAGTDILPGMKQRSALARRKSVQTSKKPGSRRTKR